MAPRAALRLDAPLCEVRTLGWRPRPSGADGGTRARTARLMSRLTESLTPTLRTVPSAECGGQTRCISYYFVAVGATSPVVFVLSLYLLRANSVGEEGCEPEKF